MLNNDFNLQEMRKIDIVEYLEKIGYQPQKIRNNDYWYLSPLRKKKKQLLKSTEIKFMVDHGIGKGANFIDFALLYHNCRLKELSKKIKHSLFFQPQIQKVKQS